MDATTRQQGWAARGGKRVACMVSSMIVAGVAAFAKGKHGVHGYALLSAGLAATFLLLDSFGGGAGELSLGRGTKYSSGGSGGGIPFCPPGMVYGLQPKRDEGEAEEDGTVPSNSSSSAATSSRRRLGGAAAALRTSMGCNPKTRIDELDGTCVNALPYATMHDSRLTEIVAYQRYEVHAAGGIGNARRHYDLPVPHTATLPPGSSFANWDCRVPAGRKVCKDPRIDGIRRVGSSAWTADLENVAFVQHEQRWVPTRDFWRLSGHDHVVLEGVDVVAHSGFQPRNFGHILHDNLPIVAWLRTVVPDTTVFLLPDTPNFRALVEFIDPDFASNRVHWYLPNQIIDVRDGTLTVSDQSIMTPAWSGNTLMRYLRHWIAEKHPIQKLPANQRTVIFYARGNIPDESAAAAEEAEAEAEAADGEASAGTKHGRTLNPQHERDILASIRAAMKRHGVKQELVFFSGTDSDGNILSYQEQLDIFRRASTIIGPHGSGLANNIWTDPFPRSCEDRVKMLEFITGTETPKIQDSFNGYYWNMRGMPIDWHQVVYAANSTRDATYIRLPDLEDALDDMWGPKR